MSPITTHVLNTATGKPAAGIPVDLWFRNGDGWNQIGSGVTDADGRIRTLLKEGHPLQKGDYKLLFHTGDISNFFPEIAIEFRIADPDQHLHVPLLLSPYGYSTYRGS